MTEMTKLLKRVDGELYRQLRSYCVAEDIYMGPAISTLIQGFLLGHITLKKDDEGIKGTSHPGSWQYECEPAEKPDEDLSVRVTVVVQKGAE